MNKIKIIFFLFLITCVTSLSNIKASPSFAFSQITVPAMQGIYTSDAQTKQTISDQYIMKTGATDKLSGDERAIGARLSGVSNTYVTVPKNSYAQLDSGTTGLGQSPVSHQLQLRATKWTVSAVYFSGIWILDDYIL